MAVGSAFVEADGGREDPGTTFLPVGKSTVPEKKSLSCFGCRSKMVTSGVINPNRKFRLIGPQSMYILWQGSPGQGNIITYNTVISALEILTSGSFSSMKHQHGKPWKTTEHHHFFQV